MKNCRLIATIPSITNLKTVEKIFSNGNIYGVRWNSGICTPYTPFETLKMLDDLSKKYSTPLWVDLKGRQLRVVQWDAPMYESIKLNHAISLDLPAKIILRGEDELTITHVKGNEIYVTPLPKHCVGAGQSVNILCDSLHVFDYLTPQDIDYINACAKLGIKRIMASFVENLQDVGEICHMLPNAEIVCKIESPAGIANLSSFKGLQLMAARDDLYIELSRDYKKMSSALSAIISSNPDAICASRIFLSLEKNPRPDFSDYMDLEKMTDMGYQTFMLCDNVCNYAFDKAMKAWEEFIHG